MYSFRNAVIAQTSVSESLMFMHCGTEFVMIRYVKKCHFGV